ncbi:MAG: arsenic resistance protein [Hydromonas sp.]|jgi:ACR3 family arsenite transporter|nr:arsenic resistance protein [Hydromonas sp.]
MWRLLSWVQQNLTWSIPTAMIAGLLFGYGVDAGFLKSLILPLTFLMVYPMMVTMNIKELFKAGGTKVQITALLMNFILIPALGYGLGLLFFADAPLIRLGLLLTSLLPTSGMTISWTGFAKGNVPAAVKMTVIGLIMGSLLAPLYLSALLGAVVQVPMQDVFVQILVIVFVPLVLGYLTQKWLVGKHGLEHYNAKIKPKFPPISTLGVLGIVFVSMALKAHAIIDHPSVLLNYLIPLVLMYAINFALSTVIAKMMFNRGDGIALVYGTVMRNLSIALAIALGVFGTRGAEAGLLIALAYVVQVQAAAWYVKLSPKLFPTKA